MKRIGAGLWLAALRLLILLPLPGCTLPKPRPAGDLNYVELARKPMPPEQSGAVLKEAGANWLYGQGLGDTALKASTVVLFPPYALVLVGNAALSLSGYETVGLSNFLPEEGAAVWGSFYDGVTAAPGRVSAAVAGREFRSPEIAREKIRNRLKGEAY